MSQTLESPCGDLPDFCKFDCCMYDSWRPLPCEAERREAPSPKPSRFHKWPSAEQELCSTQAFRGWPASSDATFPTSVPKLPEVTLCCLFSCQSSQEHWREIRQRLHIRWHHSSDLPPALLCRTSSTMRKCLCTRRSQPSGPVRGFVNSLFQISPGSVTHSIKAYFITDRI